MRYFVFFLHFLIFTSILQAQQGNLSHGGSIPAELLRPAKGEAPRYPTDMVIGALGRGLTSEDAYLFASSAARALVTGNMNANAFLGVDSILLENYLAKLNAVTPTGYRLGGGKEQADGSISYFVRFLGKELSLTGELYIRRAVKSGEEKASAKNEYVFEELILEEPKNRDDELNNTSHRYDFSPYERFF